MKRLLLICLIVITLLSACASKNRSLNTSGQPANDFYDKSEPQGAPATGGAEAPSEAPLAPAPGQEGEAAAIERLVIQNAELAIVVADVDARLSAVEAMAVEMGGYVVSSNKYQTYANNGAQAPEAQVVIRVPAENLNEALDKLKADVVEVQSESRSGQDVTAEYVDLQSRLKNLEATETQLLKIQEGATSTEDVLNVFNQLSSIREQIEMVKGQMKYYEESAALSAISVRIIAEATLQPIEIAGWKPQGVARDAIQDLVYFFQDFVDFMIRLVILVIPALVLIGIPFYLVFLGVRALFRKYRKSRVKPLPEEQPSK